MKGKELEEEGGERQGSEQRTKRQRERGLAELIGLIGTVSGAAV